MYRHYLTTLLICSLVSLLCINSLPPRASAVAGSQVRITEIMYDPIGDGSREFIEIYNGSDASVSLGGWTMAGVQYTFPASKTLASKARLVLVRNAQSFASSYPGVSVAGQYVGKLRGSGELIRIVNASGQVMSEVSYVEGGGWPTAPRNGGPSLSLVRNTANESTPGCWSASASDGGTPGVANAVQSNGTNCSDISYPVLSVNTVSTSNQSAAPTSSNTGLGSNQNTATTNTSDKTKQNENVADGSRASSGSADSKDEVSKKEAEQFATSQKIVSTKKKQRAIVLVAMLVGVSVIVLGVFCMRKFQTVLEVKRVYQKKAKKRQKK